MSRKIITFVQNRLGRDHGQQFKITEMSAYDCERWALSVIGHILQYSPESEQNTMLLMGYRFLFGRKEGDKTPLTFDQVGEPAKALALLGWRCLMRLPAVVLMPIIDPLLSCCEVNLDPGRSNQYAPLTKENSALYIQEPITLTDLRLATFRLHLDFFFEAFHLILISNQEEGQNSSQPVTCP